MCCFHKELKAMIMLKEARTILDKAHHKSLFLRVNYIFVASLGKCIQRRCSV